MDFVHFRCNRRTDISQFSMGYFPLGVWIPCDYFQSPHGNDVEFTIADNAITVDWSSFSPPENAIVLGYHVSRCVGEGCIFLTDSPFPWGTNNGTNETSIVDDGFAWDAGVEVKYAINVKYSNAETYGMAIGASYITPKNCLHLGNLNGDTSYGADGLPNTGDAGEGDDVFNVLDIVLLANCVLANNCLDIEYAYAGDLNADGFYNLLDIVLLANCVLAGNCSVLY